MSAIKIERLPAGSGCRKARVYSPDILPLMQALLRTLADTDFQFQRDLETIRKSDIDEPLKLSAIAALKLRHHERRAPYLLEINRLEDQIKQTLG